MAASLKSSRIIGDVIDGVSESGVNLNILYGSNAIHDGVTLSPAQASHAPSVRFNGGDPGALYTLLCTDPDPPDPADPKFREWLHWMVVNIPGKDANAAEGQEITSYMGPSPPVGTHRYVFILFKQPNQEPLQLEDPSGGDKMGRASFKTRRFAKDHNLGMPVAATYFLSHK